jgi:hypothetical protein
LASTASASAAAPFSSPAASLARARPYFSRGVSPLAGLGDLAVGCCLRGACQLQHVDVGLFGQLGEQHRGASVGRRLGAEAQLGDEADVRGERRESFGAGRLGLRSGDGM